MAAGEPELCTSSPFGHLRHTSVAVTGSAVVSRTRNLRLGDRWLSQQAGLLSALAESADRLVPPSGPPGFSDDDAVVLAESSRAQHRRPRHAATGLTSSTRCLGRAAQPSETGVRGPFQDPHQHHGLGLLPHVKPGDGPSDDQPLNLPCTLKYREARGGAGSFRR
jgi:hypothetical protein